MQDAGKPVFGQLVFRILILAACYYMLARLSLLLAFENTNASPVWPPSGLAFGALLIFGSRLWPGVLLGAFLANAVVFSINQASASVGAIWVGAFLIAVGNTLESWAGVRLLRHIFGPADLLDAPIRIFRFILIVLAVGMIASTVGPFVSALFGFISWDLYPIVWFTWYLGDVAGILILSTLFLPLYGNHRWTLGRARMAEMTGFLFVVFFASFVFFGGLQGDRILYDPLAFVFIPLIVFTVFRYGEYGLAATVWIMLGTAIGGTLQGFGPFVRDTLNQSLLYLEGFIGIVVTTGLILTATIRESRRAGAVVAERERWFRTLIENSNDIITLIDAEGRITYSSPSTSTILGYALEEYRGRTIFEFINPEDMTFMMSLFKDVLRKPKAVVHALCRYRHKDGHWVWLEGSGVNLLEDATVRAIVINCRDISERKRTEDQLKRYAQQLKDSNEDLENFAFVASHDLQEPLRIVSSYIQLFTKRYEESADPNIQKYIGYIKDNVGRMQEMISGLLEFSRAGKKDLVYHEVDAAKACRQAVSNLDLSIKKAQAEVICGKLPVVWSNETEMIQLFQNLIGNALKYCSRTPRVVVAAEDRGDHWRFSVKDNGIGIDERYSHQIFEVFKRLHTKSEYPGTGMGLSICKKIVERQGGRIWVESVPDQGSTFFFTLPKRK